MKKLSMFDAMKSIKAIEKTNNYVKIYADNTYQIDIFLDLIPGIFERYFKKGLKTLQKKGQIDKNLAFDTALDLVDDFDVKVDKYSEPTFRVAAKSGFEIVCKGLEKEKGVQIPWTDAKIELVKFINYKKYWTIQVRHSGEWVHA